ncbi:hypothetical protein HK102_006418 [Quaeritorhiza haematococci]|nr:hypothetical protein HK102_006418 [Quaeritorhiza haematococci]
MKYIASLLAVTALLSSTGAEARITYGPSTQTPHRRVHRREVPQEHSHAIIVNAVRSILGNRQGRIPDPIFGTLGNGAAAQGLRDEGLPSDPASVACLQQDIADFLLDKCQTIADPTANRQCKATAIKYRALERNTLKVGEKSVSCQRGPRNGELVGLRQHQDPASENATQENAQIEIIVAQKLVQLGFTAEEATNQALETSTFAAGSLQDTTGRANTCDGPPGQNASPVFAPFDGVDPITNFAFKQGEVIDCITLATVQNEQSKRVPAASREEILAALGPNSAPAPAPAPPQDGAATNDVGKVLENPTDNASNIVGAPSTETLAKLKDLLTQAVNLLN